MYNLSSKKIVSAFVLMFFCIGQGFAQYNIEKHDDRNEERKYSYGVHLGFSQHNFRTEKSDLFLQQQNFYAIEGDSNIGMEIGIIGALHPTDNIEIRTIPTIAFGNRDVVYYPTNPTDEENTSVVVKGETTAFDIPLYVKYKSKPYNDFRMFAIAGGKYRMNLSYKEAPENLDEATLRLAKSDAIGEIGLGAEIHFDLFTLAPELKVSQGFLNQRELDNTTYSQNLSALYSRIYSIAFNIE